MVWEGYFCSFLFLVLLSPYRPCDWTRLPSIINSTLHMEDQSDVRGARIKTRMGREFGRAFACHLFALPRLLWFYSWFSL